MTVKRLSLRELQRRIEKAVRDHDLDDDVHHVFIHHRGVCFDAKVETSKLATLPNGEQVVVYGLIFSVEGDDEESLRNPGPSGRSCKAV